MKKNTIFGAFLAGLLVIIPISFANAEESESEHSKFQSLPECGDSGQVICTTIPEVTADDRKTRYQDRGRFKIKDDGRRAEQPMAVYIARNQGKRLYKIKYPVLEGITARETRGILGIVLTFKEIGTENYLHVLPSSGDINSITCNGTEHKKASNLIFTVASCGPHHLMVTNNNPSDLMPHIGNRLLVVKNYAGESGTSAKLDQIADRLLETTRLARKSPVLHRELLAEDEEGFVEGKTRARYRDLSIGPSVDNPHFKVRLHRDERFVMDYVSNEFSLFVTTTAENFADALNEPKMVHTIIRSNESIDILHDEARKRLTNDPSAANTRIVEVKEEGNVYYYLITESNELQNGDKLSERAVNKAHNKFKKKFNRVNPILKNVAWLTADELAAQAGDPSNQDEAGSQASDMETKRD